MSFVKGLVTVPAESAQWRTTGNSTLLPFNSLKSLAGYDTLQDNMQQNLNLTADSAMVLQLWSAKDASSVNGTAEIDFVGDMWMYGLLVPGCGSMRASIDDGPDLRLSDGCGTGAAFSSSDLSIGVFETYKDPAGNASAPHTFRVWASGLVPSYQPGQFIASPVPTPIYVLLLAYGSFRSNSTSLSFTISGSSGTQTSGGVAAGSQSTGSSSAPPQLLKVGWRSCLAIALIVCLGLL